jgi:hypothetical protein
MNVSPRIPEKAAAALFAKTAVYIGRLVCDGTIPFKTAFFHEF